MQGVLVFGYMDKYPDGERCFLRSLSLSSPSAPLPRLRVLADCQSILLHHQFVEIGLESHHVREENSQNCVLEVSHG